MSILVTGSTGFVGQNLVSYLKSFNIDVLTPSIRDEQFQMDIPKCVKTVIHLVGKAHDVKKVSSEEEYFAINTTLTIRMYTSFCQSDADTFIYISSVKAVSDKPLTTIVEDTSPDPKTAYGKSKLKAEDYLLKNQKIGTRLYIFRPCMIHGPNNKGNLSLLYKLVKFGFPYPLGGFLNSRSYLSIDNFNFVINEFILNRLIPSGIYNIADDDTFSTIDIVYFIGSHLGRKPKVVSVPRHIIMFLAKFGDVFNLPFNTERFEKLTQDYVVSNDKVEKAIGRKLPLQGKEGFVKTFKYF